MWAEVVGETKFPLRFFHTTAGKIELAQRGVCPGGSWIRLYRLPVGGLRFDRLTGCQIYRPQSRIALHPLRIDLNCLLELGNRVYEIVGQRKSLAQYDMSPQIPGVGLEHGASDRFGPVKLTAPYQQRGQLKLGICVCRVKAYGGRDFAKRQFGITPRLVGKAELIISTREFRINLECMPELTYRLRILLGLKIFLPRRHIFELQPTGITGATGE